MCVSDPFDYQVLNLSSTFYKDYLENLDVVVDRDEYKETFDVQ